MKKVLMCQEYLDDYLLYLQNCPDPSRRNLKTYFAEREHRAGTIDTQTKQHTEILLAHHMLTPLNKALDNVKALVFEWVCKLISQDLEYFDPEVDMSEVTHEAIQEFVEDYVYAIERGIDKM